MTLGSPSGKERAMAEGNPRATVRLNIASAGNGLPTITREQLAVIAARAEPVDVYAMSKMAPSALWVVSSPTR